MTPNSEESFEASLERRRARIDRALGEFLPAESVEPSSVHQAMRYSALAGGKRLRPILVWLAGEAAGASEPQVLPAACAVELVHAYSLIHDDLPAMDDDDFRRGKPTCHRAFGEAIAILAGDALLTRAFDLLASAPLPPDRIAAMIVVLARAAGTDGMVGGQVSDLEAEGRPPDEKMLERIHRLKTAALFGASAELGAWAAGADEKMRSALHRFGEELGLAFQILDDLLDETGTSEETGKRVRKDRDRRKMTYPALLGVSGSRARAAECTERAKRALDGVPHSDELGRFGSFLLERRS
ncbi:MAG: polyprenyl synthetase family protein [Planctomycetes bacterium]|nr:polyprenyl synthetase family protein [Planctomycetota bacterium]MBI3847481.1 polyprenyl synthetase family protein [Planctomycetota bacterium]